MDPLAMLSSSYPPDAAGTWADDRFLLAECVVRGESPAAGGNDQVRIPYVCPLTHRVIAWWGRLDNGHEVLRALGLASGETSDAAVVLAAFARWGPSCADRLHGDYAAALYDPATRRLFLIRDRLGVKPLFYRLTDDAIVFSTTAALFAALKPAGQGVDRAWLAGYVVGVVSSETATGWSEVQKLAPGHWLELDQGGPCLERYHSWRDDPPWTTKRQGERVEEYRAVLEDAIRCRLRGTRLIGTENSGGIDSATVTSYLARFLGEERSRLCSFGFARGDLEHEYILETSRHAKIECNVVLTCPATLDDDRAIERGLRSVGFPDGEEMGIGHIAFYEECQQRGIRTLFSGFGGDESVTNSGSLLGRELIDHHAYATLWRTVRGRRGKRWLNAARAIATSQGWGGGHPGLWAAMQARWPHQLVRSDIVQDLGLLEQYLEQAAFDGPYRRINEFVLHNRLGPPISRRLATCTLVARSYGVEYRWPLLDARLVQLFLTTPSIEKTNREFGRYLHRRAASDVVAPKVIWKPSKDMGPVSAPSDGSEASQAATLISEARRQRANLHPVLCEVIDADRLDRQIATAAEGRPAPELAFQFRSNVTRLRWLNHWLWDGAPPHADR